MKYYFFVLIELLFFIIPASAQLSKTIEVSSDRMELSTLFYEIQIQSSLVFSYSSSDIDVDRIIEVTPRKQKLSRLLEMIVEQAELEMTRRGNRILLRKRLAEIPQYLTIQGQLIDDAGEVVPFAHLYLKGTQIGTYSDEQGRFILQVIPSMEQYLMEISAIGYLTITKVLELESWPEQVSLTLPRKFTTLAPVEVTPGKYVLTEKEPGMSALGKQQIDQSPNLIKDVFRTIRMIPSVSNTDFSVRPRIRGGHTNESAIYLDGFELINPYHIEVGGGVQGLFNTDYVESISVYPGAFSGKYTDKLSGIVDLKTSNVFEKNKFSFSLDLLNAIFSSQVKLGKNWYWSSSLRRGYWDFVIDLEARGTDLLFYDAWNKVDYRPSEKHLISLNLLHGVDKLDFTNFSGDILVNYMDSDIDKTYTWLNWKFNVSPAFFREVTVGYQSMVREVDFSFQSSLSFDNHDQADFSMFSINDYNEWAWRKDHHFSFGWEYRYVTNDTRFSETRYDIHQSRIENPVIESIQTDANLKEHLYGFYGEYTFQPEGRFQGKASFRGSGQSFANEFHLAPRINVQYQIAPSLEVSLGYGWFYQPDQFFDLRAEIGQEELNAQNSSAIHYVGNLTYQKNNTTLRLDVFHKDYNDLLDDFRFTPTQRIETFFSFENSFPAVSGVSSGFELIFNHRYGQHLLNINYAFNRGRVSDDLGRTIIRSQETPHSFSFNNLFQFKKDFSISTGVNFRSGIPYSSIESFETLSTMEGLKPVVFFQLQNKNDLRYDSYQSVDVRISKNWKGKKVDFETYLNFLNLFNTTNVRNIFYRSRTLQNGTIRTFPEENIFFPSFITPGLKVVFH